jgi:DNA-binding transcriptional ArsR family regulator
MQGGRNLVTKSDRVFRGEPVLNEERRRHILEILNRDGRVLVGDLAKQFRTSQVTIRKHLNIPQAMENQSDWCMRVRSNMIGGTLW